MTLAWADQGSSLFGFDSTLHALAQPVDGGAFRLLGTSVAHDTVSLRNLSAARSSDGQTAYFAATRESGQRRSVVIAVHLADGQTREIVRFDEPARPHSVSSNGIAEYKGWLYFTLSDPQADIWVATVSGLKK